MKPLDRIFPTALSFLLPGLGQLYQRRIAEALGFFTGFTLANLFASIGMLVPVVLVAACWDTYRQSRRGPFWRTFNKNPPEKPLQRNAAFTLVGIISFFGWVSLMPYTWLPIGTHMRVQASAEDLAHRIRFCKDSLGKEPYNLDHCGHETRMEDPWGRRYQYLRTERGFDLISLGRDGEQGTADDFRFTFRW